MNSESLPNLIVIGAAKCGTSSLHYYLGLHPDIGMSREKELNFFIEEENWKRGIDWYASHFDSKMSVRGESSPRYTSYPHLYGIPGRIHGILPDVKLIYVVRDPLERLISHYFYHYTTHVENRNIETALYDLEKNKYICQSMYYRQISRFLPYFNPDRMFIVPFEALVRTPRKTMSGIFEFLGVTPDFYSPGFTRIINPTGIKRRKTSVGLVYKRIFEAGIAPLLPCHLRASVGSRLAIPFSKPVKRPQLSLDLRTRLSAYLKKDTDRFRKFSGKAFPDWRI